MTVAAYNPATTVGRVRLLCRDTTTPGQVFEDEEIQAFIDLCGGEVLLAAAMALRTIAANEVLVQKRIKMLDLQTDGPAEADALRQLADALERRHEDGVGDGGDFDWVDIVPPWPVAL